VLIPVNGRRRILLVGRLPASSFVAADLSKSDPLGRFSVAMQICVPKQTRSSTGLGRLMTNPPVSEE
jgi:hypothetical protein